MKKKIVSVIMTICMFATLAMGCGDTNTGSQTGVTGTEAEGQNAQNVAGDCADLILGATTGFFGAESLDVAYNWDGWIMSIYGISENLYRLDENIVPQPWIAENVETPDENTWVFTIRDGVTFSNGKTVDAEAVKACFERTYEMNERADSTLKIASMEADGMQFTIVTPEPNPTLLNYLCDPLLGIYDATEEPDAELGVSCTGPYIATSFTAMTDVKMRANENYWGGEPEVDTIELKIIDDQDALDMALANGEIDLIAQETANGAAKFTDTSLYTTDTVTTTRANFLNFNLKTEGLEDIAVRQAINFCIDREGFAEVVYQGFATPCYGIYPENLTFGGTDGLNLTVDSYNPEKAKELLKEANWDPNTELDVVYYYTDQMTQDLMAIIQQYLAEVGIKMNARLVEGDLATILWKAPEDPVNGPSAVDWDMCYAANAALSLHEYYDRYQTGYSINSHTPSDPKLDELIAATNASVDAEVQRKAFFELQKYENETLFELPLYYQPIFLLQSDKIVKGAKLGNPQFNYNWDIQNWEIK